MPMRQDCRHFESRSYPNGDTVRKCNLDLAPEAPWRCPEDCAKFQPRRYDVAWNYGTLVTPETPDEPGGEGIAELLDAAEDIVNSAAPDVFAEFEQAQARGKWWKRFGRRKGPKKKGGG